MKTRFRALFALIIISALLLMSSTAAAHCDTMNGPVVTDAKVALKTGDVAPVLKWVRQADEPEIRTAFERAMKVRALGPEAREFADNYFFETLVRVHRNAEGKPYTGVKPEETKVEPVILRADQALQTGSLDGLLKQATSDVSEGIRQRFARVQQAASTANSSADEGRRYVAAYVDFIHYVESIHAASTGVSHPEHQARVQTEHQHQE